MSIRQIQTRDFLEFIIASYLASGKKPTDTEIFKALSYYFSIQKAGTPIRLEDGLFRRHPVSNVEDINDFMASIHVNLATLFQQVDEHVEQNLLLTTALMAQLRTQRTRRKKLEDKIDDILLSTYNTDGFFYSVSDHFYDTNLVDFKYTNAFLDVEADVLSIPTNSSRTRILNTSGISTPSVTMFERKDITKSVTFTEETDFSNAIDGLTNTAWYLKVNRVEPSEGVVARIQVPIASRSSDIKVTEISIVPHGVVPVQCSIQKKLQEDLQTSNIEPFSNFIKTSADKMVFVNSSPDQSISSIIIELTKASPDYYEDNVDGTRSGIYIFGMRELMLSEKAYDSAATMISVPFGIPESLKEEAIIDAVSLTTQSSVPPNSQIKYYVAPDNEMAEKIADFDWQQIVPIDSQNKNVSKVAQFSGSARKTKMIRANTRDRSDAKLITLNPGSIDLDKRNPTQAYFPNFEVYRVGELSEPFLANTLTLEEGINTTRIYHTDLSPLNMTDTFNFWKSNLENPVSYIATYGEIDTGSGFFSGADIGENERSVFVETFIYIDEDSPVTLREIFKASTGSQLWDVKAFLNGREIANMPVGTNKVVAPLKFNKGKNSLIVAANIPAASTQFLSPYIGSITFDVVEYGTIKLSDMTYVDTYKFGDDGYRDATNTSPNKWFTIFNNEIVTRTKLTDNYRLRYASATGNAPTAIRFRVDLSRFEEDNRIAPLLDSYRLRFSYSQES